MTSAASSDADLLPFARFVQRECPARVSAMLEGIYQLAWPGIAAALQAAMAQLEEDLFRHAERAPNVNEQNLSFEGLRELRRGRGEFVAACRDGVQRSILHLIDQRVPLEELRAVEPVSGRRTPLSLVDPIYLEQVLVLTEVATRAEMRASDELHALSYRLAAISGGKPAELDAVALGPHALCASVRAGSAGFDFTPTHRVALYRRIDKALFADVNGFYDAINRHLIAQKILPWLQLAPRRVALRNPGSPRPLPGGFDAAAAGAAGVSTLAPATPVAGPPAAAFTPGLPPAATAYPPYPAAPPPPAAPAQPAAVAVPAPAPTPVAAVPSQPVAAVPPPVAAPPAVEGPAMQALRRHLGAGERDQRAPAAARTTGRKPQPEPAGAADDEAESAEALSFDTLRELLAGRRRVAGAEAAGNAAEQPVASESDVDAVLSDLQAQGSGAPMQRGGRLVRRSVADVKREILAHLRARADGAPARLRAQDSDAIDLVGFLFDHLLADQQASSVGQDLLTQLQVPLIKVALKDKGFFTQRNHPARQLLNGLVETASVWLDDESQDSAVVDKMRWVVDRVNRDFDSDSAVFGRLFEDLSRHMGGLKKKADVAERHYVEAARGREKLDLARASAVDKVRQRLDRAEPPTAVRTLLESAWTDVIALAFLRQGYDHPQSRERVEFVDRLIELFGHGRPLPERRFELQKLREVFEDGLGSIGHHDDAVNRTWGDIARLVEEFGEDNASAAATTVKQLVERQPRLGGVRKDAESAAQPAAAAPGKTLLQSLRKEAPLPLSPRETEMVERIKHLPFGTWFEFTLNQQGDKARRKLCWFSPVTGHCLFVNVRGAKAQERSIENLARDLVRGNVRLVEEVRENLIDRAWKSIVAMLRGTAPGAADGEPESV